jgi:hypothetical protein
LKGEIGDAATLEAVLKSRREYLDGAAPKETLTEITEDTDNLRRALSDFPELYDFIGEVQGRRIEAWRQANALRSVRNTIKTIEITLNQIVGIPDDQPKQEIFNLLKTIDAQLSGGEMTVRDLQEKFGYASPQGVSDRLRRLARDGKIKDSSARNFSGKELRIIEKALQKSCQPQRGKKLKKP